MPTVVFSKPPKISEPVISTIAEPPPVAEAKMVPLVLLSSPTSSRRMALLNPPSNPPAFATIVPELVPLSKKTLVWASLFARANAMRVPPLLRVVGPQHQRRRSYSKSPMPRKCHLYY